MMKNINKSRAFGVLKFVTRSRYTFFLAWCKVGFFSLVMAGTNTHDNSASGQATNSNIHSIHAAITTPTIQERAKYAGLADSQVVQFVSQMQQLGRDDVLEDDGIWTRVRRGGIDQVLTDTLASTLGVPSGIADGVKSDDLAAAAATIQGAGGDTSDRKWWEDFDASVRTQFGIPADVMQGADTICVVSGLASIQEAGADPSNKDIWKDVSSMQSGTMTKKVFVNKWGDTAGNSLGSGNGIATTNKSGSDNFPNQTSATQNGSTGSSNSTRQTNNTDAAVVDGMRGSSSGRGGTKTPSGISKNEGTTSNDSAGENISAGTSLSSPLTNSSSANDVQGNTRQGVCTVTNSTNNADGSYSYDWVIHDGDNTENGHTECSAGSCTDYYDSGGSTSYEDARQSAPEDGDYTITIGSDDNNDSTEGDDSNASSDQDTNEDTTPTSDEEAEGKPVDPSSDRAHRGAQNQNQSHRVSQPKHGVIDKDPNHDTSPHGSTPLKNGLGRGVIDRAPEQAQRTGHATTHRVHLGQWVVDKAPCTDRSVVSSNRLRGPTKNLIQSIAALRSRQSSSEPATSSSGAAGNANSKAPSAGLNGNQSGSGGSPNRSGLSVGGSSGPSTWKCHRRLVKSSSGNVYLFCPTATNPVTGAPNQILIPAPTKADKKDCDCP